MNNETEMRKLLHLNETNPDAVTPQQRMMLGFFQQANELPGELDTKAATSQLNALKQLNSASLTPHERMSLGYEISNLESEIQKAEKRQAEIKEKELQNADTNKK